MNIAASSLEVSGEGAEMRIMLLILQVSFVGSVEGSASSTRRIKHVIEDLCKVEQLVGGTGSLVNNRR